MAKGECKVTKQAPSKDQPKELKAAPNEKVLRPTEVEENFEHVLRRLVIARDRKKAEAV